MDESPACPSNSAALLPLPLLPGAVMLSAEWENNRCFRSSPVPLRSELDPQQCYVNAFAELSKGGESLFGDWGTVSEVGLSSVWVFFFQCSIRTLQMCTQEQLFPGYNTSDIRVRKNKVFFQFLIIKNLLMEVILAWEQMSSIKQQPWNVAQWLVWLLGIRVFFSLLQGTLRLKGYKDIQKLSLSYYIFPIF